MLCRSTWIIRSYNRTSSRPSRSLTGTPVRGPSLPRSRPQSPPVMSEEGPEHPRSVELLRYSRGLRRGLLSTTEPGLSLELLPGPRRLSLELRPTFRPRSRSSPARTTMMMMMASPVSLRKLQPPLLSSLLLSCLNADSLTTATWTTMTIPAPSLVLRVEEKSSVGTRAGLLPSGPPRDRPSLPRRPPICRNSNLILMGLSPWSFR